MRRVTAYALVPVNEVDVRLREGWQPWGNPLVVQGILVQPMVIYGEDL